MFYAVLFLLLSSSGKPVNRSENAPEFRDFHQRIWAGEVNLGNNDVKTVYGRVHWEQLSRNMREARFNSIEMRMVSDRHACPQDMRRLLLA
jgi:hypothetical protein